MIKFEKLGLKEYSILDEKDKLIDLNLVSSTITNKFNIVTDFIERMSEHSPDFTNWFKLFTEDLINKPNDRWSVIDDNISNIQKFCDEFIDSRNIDFSKFVDESKSKKSSILFSVEEIEKIIKLSSYLKIYCIVFNSENLKLDQRSHREIYNKFCREITKSDIMYKIFNIIKMKTYRYNISDKFMWDYIKTVQCKTIDVHVIEIFNFIMNSILIICEEDRNPITYFISVVEESVKWFLRSVYKGSVIYSDTISTEDIQSPNIDNLKTYSYNDTLGSLKGVAYEKIYQQFEKSILTFEEETEEKTKSDEQIVDFQNRVMDIKFISPLCDCLVYPILSQLTSIPYNHFKTLSEDHAAILSLYVQDLMKKVFKNDYKNMISLLGYYPTNQPADITTYKLKTTPEFVNLSESVKNFFGFESKITLYQILCYFVGRVSRMTFFNTVDGKGLGGIPLSKLEQEMIQFFTYWFSGKLEEEFSQMKKLLENDF